MTRAFSIGLVAEFGRRVVLQMALISPSVIYRTKIGEGGVLRAHELTS
jgi:hypothetical protein